MPDFGVNHTKIVDYVIPSFWCRMEQDHIWSKFLIQEQSDTRVRDIHTQSF